MYRGGLVGGMVLALCFYAAPAFGGDPTCAAGAGTVPGDLVWEGVEGAARIGTSVACAGDLTGDGRAELVAGAPYAIENDVECGKAYILAAPEGAAGAIPVTGATVLTTIITAKKNSLLGMAVAGIGDFDGDGFNDLAIGLPGAPGYVDGDGDDNVAYTGAVQIIYGVASMPAIIDTDPETATRIVGAGAGEQTGFALAAAGDINGDGAPDLIIGAPRARNRTNSLLDQTGRVYIIFGGRPRRAVIDLEDEADVTIEGGQSYARLGTAVAGVGDVNGDGVGDVAMGAPHLDTSGYVDAGEALVIYGSPSLPAEIDSTARLEGIGFKLLGRGNSIKLGSAVAGADVNGDAFADLVAGAPQGGDKQAGSAYIVFGGSALPADLTIGGLGDMGVAIAGAYSYGYLGAAIAGTGDMNADGVDDIALGAPNAPNGVFPSAGAVFLLNGRASWPQTAGVGDIASRTILGARAYAGFGDVLSGAGDHNGDAGLDLAVGVPRQSPNDVSCAGQVSVFLGEFIPGPSNVTCTTTLLDVALAWVNNHAYSEIIIARDGQTLAALPGDATAYTDLAVPIGSHIYGVTGVAATGVASNAAECTVQVQVLPVRDAACVADARIVALTWSLGMPYDAIKVSRNGILLAELPGDAVAWTDAEAPYGALSYSIAGIAGSFESIPVTCEVYVPRPPAELTCAADGLSVALSWTEPEIFDRVEILKDGALLTVLPGGVASFLDMNVRPGDHVYALRAFLGTSRTESIACQVTVLPAPSNVSCTAAVYSVAVTWDLEAAYDAIAVFLDGERVATLPGDAQAHTIESLAPGIRLVEVAGECEDALSARAACTVEVLAAPAGLACTAEGDRVVLVWQNASTYAEIAVIRDGAEIARLPGGTSSFSDTTAVVGRHAYEIYGTADRSVSARATCEVDLLSPPADVTCAAIGSDVTVAWVNASTYETIVITRDGAIIVTLPGTAAEYLDAGVALGSHVYTLQGFVGASHSVPASCEIVSSGAPSALVCTALGTNVALAWSNGDVYDEIRVLRNDEIIALVPGDTRQYVDATAAAGQTYDYKIVAVIGMSLSDPASCRIVLPLAPVSLVCAAVEGRVHLAWQIEGAADAVIVARNGEDVTELPAGTTAFEETVPVPGVYLYGVSTVLGSARSDAAACEIETVHVPQAFACIATGGVVTLNWALDGEYDAFVLMRNGTEIARLPGDAVTYEDGGIAPGDYVYTLVAESGTGTASSSCEVHAPAPPVNLNCFVVDGAITLSWENAEAYDQIVIFRNDAQIAVLGGDAATYRDGDIEPGVVYTYDIIGQRGLDRTPPVSCAIKIPAAVASFECAAAGNDVMLAWTVRDTYDEIRIARNGQTIASGLAGTTTMYEDVDLAPGAYSYEVTGLIGDAKSPAAACEVTILPPPEGLQCQILAEAGTVRLAWTNPMLYETVTIARNDQVIVQLAGAATQYIEKAPEPGAWTYAVSGGALGSESPPATCTLTVLQPPRAVECVGDGSTVTITWALGGTYVEIHVLCDGTLIATLPGTDTSYTDGEQRPGTHVYRLIGIGAAGSSSLASAPCTTEIVTPPEQMICSASASGMSMTVSLSWSLAGTYDSQAIERTGPDGTQLIAQVDGSETTYVDAEIAMGTYAYRVIASIGLNSAASAPCEVESTQPRFVRGDANCDRTVNIADSIFTLSALFRVGTSLPCLDAADATDDGAVDTSDVIYAISYLFTEGPPPPPPFPALGFDLTADPHAPDGDLGCEVGL